MLCPYLDGECGTHAQCAGCSENAKSEMRKFYADLNEAGDREMAKEIAYAFYEKYEEVI